MHRRAQGMELNIPAIHGVGESLIYFVDRYDEFSIYDIDFHAIKRSTLSLLRQATCTFSESSSTSAPPNG
jgi:4-hydroxyphenylpyruvate dioxygenase-like putative hemolysin